MYPDKYKPQWRFKDSTMSIDYMNYFSTRGIKRSIPWSHFSHFTDDQRWPESWSIAWSLRHELWCQPPHGLSTSSFFFGSVKFYQKDSYSFQHHSNCLLQMFPSSTPELKEHDCIPSFGSGEHMPSEATPLSPFTPWILGTSTVHGTHALEFHFPFTNSHLSSKNSLWWDLSPRLWFSVRAAAPF